MTQHELFSKINRTARRILNPTWEDISSALTALRHGAGSVTLETSVGTRLPSLECRAEGQNYLVTLAEIDTDGETGVRSLTLPQSEPSMIDILGDSWDCRQVTRDHELVAAVFREFLETGTVGELLD